MNHVTAITYYVPVEKDDIEDTIGCIKSYKPFVDRFIVIQNGEGMESKKIRNLADVFVLNKVNKLMAGAVNEGYRLATAFKDTEYLMFIDNGTKAVNFDMNKYFTDGIASPHIGRQDAAYRAHACLFVVHKDNFEQVGLWDSSVGNIADDVWFRRAMSLGIPTYQTDDLVSHDHPGKTSGKISAFSVNFEML